MYDHLIVGSGLFGATFAYFAHQKGKRCLVIEARKHCGGNLYCEKIEGINVHKYGAHIFHTNSQRVWKFVNSLVEFNRYTNSPIANYQGELYNLPFNMNTFHQMWGVKTPEEAMQRLNEQRKEALLHMRKTGIDSPRNLEEQALLLIGKDIYEKLIKGYTEKQWGRSATELPAFIIRRLPVRYTYDNNYFNDTYQGIPIGGYTKMIEAMLDHENIEVELNVDFFAKKDEYLNSGAKIVFTGMIDEFFDYELGTLEYRSLRFETEVVDVENYQGNAVVNYTDREMPYTRIIEHKHFEFGTQPKTVITREYPADWKVGDEPYYPVNNQVNNDLYAQYKKLAQTVPQVIFGGRLGQYRYYDMHQVIAAALETVKHEFE